MTTQTTGLTFEGRPRVFLENAHANKSLLPTAFPSLARRLPPRDPMEELT